MMSSTQATGKRGRGRPTKLTPEVFEKMVLYQRAGLYFETAAALCGIDRTSRLHWLTRGREDLDCGRRRTLYAEFFIASEKAVAESEARDLQTIAEVGHGHEAKYDKEGHLVRPAMAPTWQALAWRLERRFPDRYGRSTVKVQGDPENPIPVKPVVEEGDPIDRVIEILGVLAESGALQAEGDPGDRPEGTGGAGPGDDAPTD